MSAPIKKIITPAKNGRAYQIGKNAMEVRMEILESRMDALENKKGA